MTSTQFSIDAALVLQYGWPLVCTLIGWFIVRLIRQYDGHSTAIAEVRDTAHKDRLDAAEKYAKRDDLNVLRTEIRDDLKALGSKLDDRFDGLIRELRK